MGKFFALVLAALAAVPARASVGVRILAVVNGEAITSYDLGQRVGLAKALVGVAGVVISDDELGKRVFEEMVDDKVKVAEAAKYGISATPEEVAQMRSRMEAALRLGDGGYGRVLGDAGVSEEALRSALFAEATWMKFVAQVLRVYVQVRDGDVDSAIEGMGRGEAVDYVVVPLVLPGDGAAKAEAEVGVRGISDCGAFAEAAGRLGAKGSGAKLRISSFEMQPALLDVLKDAPVSTPLAPHDIGGQRTVFFVCEKSARAAGLGEAERERLRYEILQGKLDAYAAKYFENAKSAAAIDIRKE